MSSADVKSMGRMLRQVEDPSTRRLLESILNNIDVLTSSVEALENPVEEGWIDVVLENGWVRYNDDFSPPQFRIDKFGNVRLRGLIKSGTTSSSTVLFSLPEGYRPELALIFNTESQPGSHSRFDIYPNGEVRLISGGSAFFSLDNSQFLAYR